MAIFYRQDIEKPAPAEKPDTLKETTQARLDALQKELEWEKDIERKRRIREEILSIKREFNRTKRYTDIMNMKPAEGKNSLDTISAANLMRIDKESKLRRGEFLSKSFLYKRTIDKEGNIFEEPSDGKNLKEWDILFVDFGKNKSANNRIGLWNMLSADIGYVKVGERIGVRAIINWRVGYYTKPSPDGYIPVFTSDTVIFPTASDISVFEKQKDANLQRNSSQEESDKANDLYIEQLSRIPDHRWIELNIITKESYDFWKSKWFSHEQACGIVANEYRESSANPKATNGIAVGIFQWEWPRKDSIEKKYWRNIVDMSHLEQLEIAWWEMNNTESRVLEPLRNTTTAQEAGAIFSRVFERPRDEQWEMNVRWELAELFASQIEWKWVSPIAILWSNKETIEHSLVNTSFFWNTVKLHKAIIWALQNAESEIKNESSLKDYKIYRVDGYNWRNMRGKWILSNHALWIALDINPEENMWDFWNGNTDIPQKFVDIMKKNGFVWWGDWKNPYDPMHFEYSKPGLLTQALNNSDNIA